MNRTLEGRGETAGMVSFESPQDRQGVAIVDSLERRRYVLSTPGPVDPEPVADAALRFPVDAAVRVTTDAVVVTEIAEAVVRDSDGHVVSAVHPPVSVELPRGAYTVELNAPIKVYLEVESPVAVDATHDRILFEFGEPTRVRVGARSYHERPAATIRTTPDPEDLLVAVSHLGSALKTTTCERSYSTLRGHPPALELDDDLHVPDGIAPPETDVTLVVPPHVRDVFVVAPLAFYLGATLEPGDDPRLVTDHGFEHSLAADRGLEDEVAEVLRQAFLLDCLTRTEGLYPVDLHERRALDDVLDFAALYDQPTGRQLEAYLSVPHERVADHVPTWQLTAHVDPDPVHAPAIPFLLDDLAVVRIPEAHDLPPAAVRSSVLDAYFGAADASGDSDGGRGPSVRDGMRDPSARGEVRGPPTPDGPDRSRDRQVVVEPDQVESREQVWFGEYVPVGGTKGVLAGYWNDLARTPDDGPIDITVVCNDPEMGGERDAVAETYGTHDDLPFDVTVHRDLSEAALRRVLATDADFLHYIGHIDDDGFACTDGALDAATLDSVGAVAFLLNACRSYEQGLHLVEAGSVGGVVTLGDVLDAGAVRVGLAMARLLDVGFPLEAALSIARGESVVGGHYIVVGKGNVDVVQEENAIPVFTRVDPVGEDRYDLALHAYLPREGGMGSIVYPCLAGNDRFYLAPGYLETFRLSRADLEASLALQPYPVAIDGTLVWDEDLEAVLD